MLWRNRSILAVALAAGACKDPPRDLGEVGPATAPGADTDPATTADADGGATTGGDGDGLCCAEDGLSVTECSDGAVYLACPADHVCDPATLSCVDLCAEADDREDTVGCEYYAVPLPAIEYESPLCHAAVLSNPSNVPAQIHVDYKGSAVNLAGHFVSITGAAPGGTPIVEDLDPANGVPPQSVGMVLLSGLGCPGYVGQTAAVPDAAVGEEALSSALGDFNLWPTTGIGHGFRIRSNVPVTAYQVLPFLAPSSHMPASSLLVATRQWGKNYIVLEPGASLSFPIGPNGAYRPFFNVVAAQDNTTVKLLPSDVVEGGPGLASTLGGETLEFVLDAGQHAQFVQFPELTGSIIEADKPVGMFVGHECQYFPHDVEACEHMEQMVVPVGALGSQYVAAPVQRLTEAGVWRLLGAVDGTELSWSTDVGGPTTLERGEHVFVDADTPFVVASQDLDHPFWLFNYMTGQMSFFYDGVMSKEDAIAADLGDPDFVTSLPPQQYVRDAVFFVDPTYPHTQVVVVRQFKPEDEMQDFAPVALDCATGGVVQGWETITDEFEFARVNFREPPYADCTGGIVAMESGQPFGAWVWTYGNFASVAYPAGMGLTRINDVMIPAQP